MYLQKVETLIFQQRECKFELKIEKSDKKKRMKVREHFIRVKKIGKNITSILLLDK
jgi:hypothetical protein